MYDWPTEVRFQINGPSYIQCATHPTNRPHNTILIDAGAFHENTIRLDGICEFAHAQPGIYYILFNQIFPICTGGDYSELSSSSIFTHLYANTSFIIPDNHEDTKLNGETLSTSTNNV
jgi:hypothetical protein